MALTPPAFNGRYYRPSGSDGYPPAVGTLVVWRATRPIVEAATQAVKDGVVAYVLGDTGHLRKHGDHTGHSAGKVRGRVYATDIMIHAAEPARTRLLAYLRSDADTRWIDFVNFAGAQYSYAGVRVAASGDYHFHLSVNKGYEDAATGAADLVHYVLTGQRLKPVSVPQKPLPTPTPTNQDEDDDMKLVKLAGSNKVYRTTGLKRVLVADEKALKALTLAGYKLVEIPAELGLDAFGPVVTDDK